jgi:hypothetical protein
MDFKNYFNIVIPFKLLVHILIISTIFIMGVKIINIPQTLKLNCM